MYLPWFVFLDCCCIDSIFKTFFRNGSGLGAGVTSVLVIHRGNAFLITMVTSYKQGCAE